MNAYRFNAMANSILRSIIVRHFNVGFSQVYKKVKHINSEGIFTTDDGKIYKIIIKEIEDEL